MKNIENLKQHPSDSDLRTVETAIIGHGPQGVAVATHLAAWGYDDFLMIAPNAPLSDWKNVTSRQGMTHYRSPFKHYLSLPGDLDISPENNDFQLPEPNAQGGRPSLAYLNGFHDEVVRKSGIQNHHLDGQVVNTNLNSDGTKDLTLEISKGNIAEKIRIQVNNVVLATGRGKPKKPDIQGFEDTRVIHSHEIDVTKRNWQGKNVLIIGSGQSGFGLSYAILERGGMVTLTSRSTPNINPLDFDAGYFGGKEYEEFKKKLLGQRADIIEAINARGRVHPHTHAAASSHENFTIAENTTVGSLISREHGVEVDGLRVFDLVICCTGYKTTFGENPWEEAFASVSEIHAGLPNVDTKTLEFKGVEGVYATGKLASLGHGPAAANFGMADMNAEAIATHLIRRSASTTPQNRF